MNDQGPWTHLLMTLITVAGVAGMMWIEMDPAYREMLRREARQKLRRLAGRLAAASGHRAMGNELHGTPETLAGYGFTYRLSRLRDRL